MHPRWRQASLLEDPIQCKSHLHVCPRTPENFMSQGDARRPERKRRGKEKKRRPRRLLEGEDSTRSNQPNKRGHNDNGIGNKHQNETADGGIERLAALDLVHIGLGEAYIAQTGLRHASPGPRDRTGITLYPHHLPRRTNQPGCQHSHVSDAGTKIQDTLTWTNACLAEESFGVRCNTCSLPNEALVFRIGAA